MASSICVRPRELLEALYSDLLSGNKAVRGLQVCCSTEVVEGVERQKVEIVFDFCTRLSRSGRINLEVSGISQKGFIEAEHEAVVSIFEALRTEHQIFIADFNYVVISERWDKYNVRRKSLHVFCKTYDSLEKIAKDCESSLGCLLCDVSKTVGNCGMHDQYVELDLICEYHARLRNFAAEMEIEIRRERRLVESALEHDVETEVQRRFELTVPTPMQIDWDGSFSVLHTIFSRAIKVLNLNVSEIRVDELSGGQFEANVDMIVDPISLYGADCHEEDAQLVKDPVSFRSSPYPSPVGAKSIVIYQALKYVRGSLGLSIIDLNYDLEGQLQDFGVNFGSKVKDIWGCGSRLKSVFDRCEEVHRRSSKKLDQMVPRNEAYRRIFDAISLFGGRLKEFQNEFWFYWGNFTDQKNVMVDRGFVDSFMLGSFI